MLNQYRVVPDRSGCYVLTTFTDEILYIGLSCSLHDRFQQHLSNPRMTKETTLGMAVWFYFEFCDENTLNRLERTWLNHFVSIDGSLPLLNKINSPLS